MLSQSHFQRISATNHIFTCLKINHFAVTKTTNNYIIAGNGSFLNAYRTAILVKKIYNVCKPLDLGGVGEMSFCTRTFPKEAFTRAFFQP